MELVPKIRKQYIVSGTPAEVREKLYAATDPTGKHKTRPLRGNQGGEEFVVSLRHRPFTVSLLVYDRSPLSLSRPEARIRLIACEKGTQVCITYKEQFSSMPLMTFISVLLCAYPMVYPNLKSLPVVVLAGVIVLMGRAFEWLHLQNKMPNLEKTIKQIIA